ncbi:hypothetical protein CPter91_3612 [Collimonas pratensis]|uniref:Uncharacterized protein n=1 Tax=Collimonas pratensis TaxID=279113 RepID=A0A127Q7C1_9BURK|nr:hypothetical protein CPter91_3612 [Collimonas pratensis]
MLSEAWLEFTMARVAPFPVAGEEILPRFISIAQSLYSL